MKTFEAIAIRISNLSIERDITLYELSKVSGVAQTTIKDIVYGRSKNPSIKNIERIANGFGMSVRDFFDDDLFISK